VFGKLTARNRRQKEDKREELPHSVANQYNDIILGVAGPNSDADDPSKSQKVEDAAGSEDGRQKESDRGDGPRLEDEHPVVLPLAQPSEAATQETAE
jgi:hypothetical protein